jgi:hypothetical protein
MGQPTSMLQRLDPRMLDPDALEQVTTQAMVAPGQDDAVRGFVGATLPYLTKMRQQRAADYTQQIGETNQLQMLMQQRAQQAAMDKAALDYDQEGMKQGFAPGITDIGRRMLTPGALSGLNRVQQNREQMQRATAFKDTGAGAASFANANVDAKPDEVFNQTGIQTVDGTPTRLDAARIAAQAKSGGTNNVTIQTTGVDNNGNPVVITNRGPNAAQAYAGANVAPPGTPGAAPAIPMTPKASAAIDQINAQRAAEGKSPIRKNAFVQQPNGTYVAQGNGRMLIIDQFGKVSEK